MVELRSSWARIGPLALAALFMVQAMPFPSLQVVQPAAATSSPAFGVPGQPLFATYALAGGGVPAGEPTMGVAHNLAGAAGLGTDAMYEAFVNHYKLSWNSNMPPTMTTTRVTAPTETASTLLGQNWDPILYTSPVQGRTWAGQLALFCNTLVGGLPGGVDPGCPFMSICDPVAWAPAPPVGGGNVGTPLGIANVWSGPQLAFGIGDPLDCIMTCDLLTQTPGSPNPQPILPTIQNAVNTGNPNTIATAITGTQQTCAPTSGATILPANPNPGPGVQPGLPGAPGQGLPVGAQCTANTPCILATYGCTIMSYTDNNGATWTPMADPCALPAWDHESIGSGPWVGGQPLTATFPEAVYYCAQLGDIYCWISSDGGKTFLPSRHMDQLQQARTGCGGIHGHIRADPNDGTVYLPNKGCPGKPSPNARTGFMTSTDNGDTWSLRLVPLSPTGAWPNGQGNHDPSLAVDAAGTVYLGQAENPANGRAGAYIAISDSKGVTWEDVGGKVGAPVGTKYFNVASLVPGIDTAEFAEVIAGDAGRAAYAFLGGSGTGNSGNCGSTYVWNLYIAMTYDKGASWSVTKATADPVQRDGIWPGGGGAVCRNLLDFNDIVVDNDGRVLVAYTDGCVTAGCTGAGGAADFASEAWVARQYTGKGLYVKSDVPCEPADPICNDFGTKCIPERPEILEVLPGEGALVTEENPSFTGFTDRHRTPGPITANANGPYSDFLGVKIPILGTADCAQELGFSCTWQPIGPAPTFDPGADVCNPTVDYGIVGTFHILLTVTDTRSGMTDTAIAPVTVKAPTGVPPPPPPPIGGASCASGTGTTVDDDADNDHATPFGAGTNEITCFAAEYSAPNDAIVFKIVVADKTAPVVSGSDSSPEYYWIRYTPTFGSHPGRPQLIEAYWNNAELVACIRLDDNQANSQVMVGGAPGSGLDGSVLCDPNRAIAAAWAGNTLSLPVPSRYFYDNVPSLVSTGTGFVAGGKLQGTYAEAWHIAQDTNWNGCYTRVVTPPVCVTSSSGTARVITDTDTNYVIGTGATYLPDDFAPDCKSVEIKFPTPTTLGVSASCNPNTPITATAPGGGDPSLTMPVLPDPSGLPLIGALVATVVDTINDQAAVSMPGVTLPNGMALPSVTLPGVGLPGGLIPQLPSLFNGGSGPGNPNAMAAQAPGNGQSTTADMRPAPCDAPAPDMPDLVASPPKEFVRLIPDWDFVNPTYLAQDTSVSGYATYATPLRAFTAADNGLHTLRAEWWDNSGTVLMGRDCMAFVVAIPELVGSQLEAPQEGSPNSNHIGTGDVDKDGVPDLEDNCPQRANVAQRDGDLDGMGDVCDPDLDNDGILNRSDNCPVNPNPDHKDTDADGIGDVCDSDSDSDGIPDLNGGGKPVDNCRLVPNTEQEDSDGDGFGDACEMDTDKDGRPDYQDAFPKDPSEWADMNLDGLGDNANPPGTLRPAPLRQLPASAAAPSQVGLLTPSGVVFLLLAIACTVGLGVVVQRRRNQ